MSTEITIVVDSREKKPLPISYPIVRAALKYGDYAVQGREGVVAIEWKSAWDWVSCCRSKANRARLERQVKDLVDNVRCPLLVVELPPPEYVVAQKFPGFKRQFCVDEIMRTARTETDIGRFITVFPVMNRLDAAILIEYWLFKWLKD